MKQLTCIMIAFAVVGIYADEPDRIVNGIPTNIQQYPSAVSIRSGNSHMCGGTLISSTCVLTAAHCLVNQGSGQGLTIVTGTTYLNSGGQSHRVARLIVHPSYNRHAQGRDAGYDIGIIKLAAPVQFSSTQRAASLPTRGLTQGEDVTTVAWGSKGFRQNIHNDLQKLPAKCMSASTCQTYHRSTGMQVHPNEFCTLVGQGTGTCNGDSGSGVLQNNIVVGLVSGGIPCARGYPDVFTGVYPFLSWIQQYLN